MEKRHPRGGIDGTNVKGDDTRPNDVKRMTKKGLVTRHHPERGQSRLRFKSPPSISCYEGKGGGREKPWWVNSEKTIGMAPR